MIALKIVSSYNISDNIQFLVSALVASITVSGKALGKEIAKKNATSIVYTVGIIISKFVKDNNKNT